MATRSRTTTSPSEQTKPVSLAPGSHYDQVCTGDYVFTRGEPATQIPVPEADRLLADFGCLESEESA